jgi:flagellar hook-associated protein FlgK
MAKQLKALSPIIYMFLVIVIGVAFVVSNANSISTSVQSQPITDESVNFASARIAANLSINESKVFTVTYNPVAQSNLSLTDFVLTNASGSAATVTTDYVVNLATGGFTLKNTTFWLNPASNISLVDYNYYDNNYVEDTGTRTMLSLIVFFLALGILFVVIRYVGWDKLKEWFGEQMER